MKLLRIQSNDDELVYNGFINDSLILNEKSKIALQSVSWQKDVQTIVITASNQNFIFRIEDPQQANIDLVAALTSGLSYSLDQLDSIEGLNTISFIDDLQRAFNHCLDIAVNKCIGLKVNVFEEKNLLNLKFRQSAVIDFFRPLNSESTNYKNVNVATPHANIYAKNPNGVATYDSALYGFNKDSTFFRTDEGCGILRIQIDQLHANGNAYYVGLSTFSPDNMANDFSFETNKLTFGIEVVNNTTNYQFIKRDETTGNITKTLSATPVNKYNNGDENDYIEISCNKGKIQGRIYQHTGGGFNTTTVLFSEEFGENLNQDLFPIIGFNNENGNRIKKLRYTPEDHIPEIGNNLVTLVEDAQITSVPSQNRDPVTYTITFPSQSLADFLQFDDVTTVVADSTNFELFSDRPIQAFDQSEHYIVLLESLNLKSYDYQKDKAKRRNILQVIPNIRNKAEKDFLYNTDNPLFIDINNAGRITLNNLILRVLDTNESKVNIKGVSEMVLFVKDRDE